MLEPYRRVAEVTPQPDCWSEGDPYLKHGYPTYLTLLGKWHIAYCTNISDVLNMEVGTHSYIAPTGPIYLCTCGGSGVVKT